MGYQESYVTTKDPNDFPKLVQYYKSKGPEYYHEKLFSPVQKITLKKTTSDIGPTTFLFPVGQEFVYVVGERQNQRTPSGLCDDPDLQKEIRRYYTEEMPSDEIFGDQGDEYALIEPFWAEETP